jgi:dTDP-4-dehydrorhamnose reductase
MKILITGANGMVARALIKHCQSINDSVAAFARREMDVSNRAETLEIVAREQPGAIINCAAYTNVDGAETNQELCYAANAAGVENLALAAKEANAAFVTISTDYVFDGSKKDFYTQRDDPNPQSVYGKSKLAGERAARDAYARSIIVRSGWIYGADGTNFLSILPQLLAEGKPVKAITDAYGTPTFAGDLARRLRELALLDLPAVYHVTNSGAGTSYEGFARAVCELKNFDSRLLERVSNDTLKRPAPRPQSSKLKCLLSERLGLAPLPDWKDALKNFLN